MFDFLNKQFIDVIEWMEETNGVLAYRYPVEDREIQHGAQLTVRESQIALFVNEGRVADQFDPGRHKLGTSTLPILTNLMNWDKAFQSPFKSDVYFFSTREQVDQRWGTQAPITIRDKMFGAIRLRAHGTYSYKIEDPKLFHQKISGTRKLYTVEELDGQLRAAVLTSLASMFGNADVSFLDMAANQTHFSNHLQNELQKPFADFGLKLSTFFVQSITLPENIQEYLDKSTSMKMLGDMRQYTQFQAAESLPIAAANEGGLAGVGAGLGAGMTIGQAFSTAFTTTAPADASSAASGDGGAKDDSFETLNRLHELLTKGIITQEEFDAKKAEVLRNIT